MQLMGHNGIPTQELTMSRFRTAVDAALTAHANALVEMDASADASRQFAADMSGRLDEHAESLRRLASDVNEACGAFLAFRHMGMMARLRWLIAGR